MRRKSFITPLVLIVCLFLPFFAKAQIDTAWVTNEHASQYIFPSIIDEINYNNQPYTDRIAMLDGVLGMTTINPNLSSYNTGIPIGIAQKFEVEYGDSVSLMGVAAVLLQMPSAYGIFDTIKISILNGRFTELYSKLFYTCDSLNNHDYLGKYAEYMFDEQITLYEDYYIAIEFLGLYTLNGNITLISFLTLNEYAWWGDLNRYNCAPYGINTKYRPHVKFSYQYDNEWIHVDDVNWYSGYGYENHANYQTNPELGCDTIVCKAVGICPIRALENSTSTGGGSTSTDDDSTSTGGGDSFIATVLADEDIELYPNPADEVLNIRSDYNITEIEVIDAMNRVIERWELNSRELTLDVASYKSGTYFIIIKTDKGSLTKKFIVR